MSQTSEDPRIRKELYILTICVCALGLYFFVQEVAVGIGDLLALVRYGGAEVPLLAYGYLAAAAAAALPLGIFFAVLLIRAAIRLSRLSQEQRRLKRAPAAAGE